MSKKKEESKKAKPSGKKSGKAVKVKKAIVPASLPVLVPTTVEAPEPEAVAPKPTPVAEAVKVADVAKPKAAKPAKTKPAKAAAPQKAPVGLSNDDIALRAYFLSEARRARGEWADSGADWLEAERQLRAEAEA
jgi:hypothetical protein